MAELADAPDSKSGVRKGMRVRLPPSAFAPMCKYCAVTTKEVVYGGRILPTPSDSSMFFFKPLKQIFKYASVVKVFRSRGPESDKLLKNHF